MPRSFTFLSNRRFFIISMYYWHLWFLNSSLHIPHRIFVSFSFLTFVYLLIFEMNRDHPIYKVGREEPCCQICMESMAFHLRESKLLRDGERKRKKSRTRERERECERNGGWGGRWTKRCFSDQAKSKRWFTMRGCNLWLRLCMQMSFAKFDRLVI